MPQNGDRIVAVDSVTSLHPIYSLTMQCIFLYRSLSWQLFGWLGNAARRHALTTVVIATMSFQGIANVQHQRSIRAEFSNPSLEQLIHWINSSTPTGINSN